MHYKSLLKGIGLTLLFSFVKSEDCNFIHKHESIGNCYSEDNVPYYLNLSDNFNNTVLNDITKLTGLKEISIYNTLNVTADYSILKKLKKLKTFNYEGILDDVTLKSISKLTSVTDLTVESTVSGNVDLKSLKGLKLQTLTVNCHNYNVEDSNYLVSKTLNNFANTLKELIIADCLIDDNEDLSKLTKVNRIIASGWIDKRLYKKVAAMKSVKYIRFYYQKKDVGIKDIYEIDVSDLKSAPKLTELEISSALSRYRDRNRVKVGSLSGFKKLKSLYFHAIGITQENIDEISKIKNIESLTFNGCSTVTSDDGVEPTYDSLVNLKSSLKYLSYAFPKKAAYDSDKFSDFPEFILSLTNLKNLTINDCYIKSIPDKIVDLKKLEHLDLSKNNLQVLPDNINQLKKLKYLDVSSNGDLKGKTLNSNKLEYCNYSKTTMCKDVDVKCLKDAKLDSCNSECNQYFNYLVEVQKFKDFDSGFCEDNEEGKAVSAYINDSQINEDSLDQLLAFKDTITSIRFIWSGNQNTLSKISQFTSLNELAIIFNNASEILDLSPLNNLVDLVDLSINNENEMNCYIKDGSFDKLSKLNVLRLQRISLTQGLVDDIGKLTKLGVLDIDYSSYPKDINYDSWKNLQSLFLIYLRNTGKDETPLYEIPKSIYSLKISRMTINYQKISTIDSDIANMTNLSDLDMRYNDLTSLPEALNTMKKLSMIDFSGNPNMKGKIVDNDNVTSCYYDSNKNLCKPKENIYCLSRLVIPNPLPLCN